MSIAEDLFSHLVANAGVSAINGDRVYPAYRETGATALVYQEVSANKPFNLALVDDVESSIYQIDCWADRYETARALSDAVTAALHKTKILNGQPVELIYQVSRRDDYDPTGDGLHRVILEFSIHH